MVWTRRLPGLGAPRSRTSGTYARKHPSRMPHGDPGSNPGGSTTRYGCRDAGQVLHRGTRGVLQFQTSVLLLLKGRACGMPVLRCGPHAGACIISEGFLSLTAPDRFYKRSLRFMRMDPCLLFTCRTVPFTPLRAA